MNAYLHGIQLFNQGEYWHAHEQWEACWIGSREPEATFYKGIIQAAAALVHWQRGNLRGLRRNWAKSRPKLVALPSKMKGVDVYMLIADMDRFVLVGHTSPQAPRLRYDIEGSLGSNDEG